MKQQLIELNINGRVYEVPVYPRDLLADVIRNKVGLTVPKKAVGRRLWCLCVLIDGKPVLSCLTLAISCQGKQITTIEGLVDNSGRLHPIQQAFVDKGAVQCGFCTPGMILSSKALLDRNPNPSELEIKRAIAGNICRCTGYKKIIEAIFAAGETISSEGVK